MRGFLSWIGASAAIACTPSIELSVSFDGASACIEEGSAGAVAIEMGDCANSAGRPEWSSDLGTTGSLPAPLEPGSYCLDALAYRAGAGVCRLEALARETRSLPRERGQI